MFKTVETFQELMDTVHADRTITGDGASTANRFPVRFVLFDNFRDCCSFVEEIMHIGNIQIQRIDDWMDNEYPDTMLTHAILAQKVKQVISDNPSEYRILMPFSELARFYNNTPERAEFNSLINTIKGYDCLASGYAFHQRIYIPIVGLEGKMQHFRDDTQSFIWYFHNADRQLDYKLILTDGTTFGVQGLESKYDVAESVSQWLGFWKYPELKSHIISTSHSLFSHEKYAKPDNAFRFYPCYNSHQFLTEGLQLDVSCIEYKEDEIAYWDQLAHKIDIRNFKFESFFNEQFGIFNLADNKVFFETWYKNKQPFMRWLLAKYYTYKFCDQGYICRVLNQLEDYSDLSFTKALVLTIFSLENKEEYIEDRKLGLQLAAHYGMELAPDVQSTLIKKINEEAAINGYPSAVSYLSSLSYLEKHTIIEWYKSGIIKKDDLRELYPDLFNYLLPTIAPTEEPWVLDYFDKYKEAKVSNTYTDDVRNYILQKNKNSIEHYKWSNNFSTTRTIMSLRPDIQCYYWIDGLGVDWIPFIQQILKDREQDGYYLNEVFIATAKLPTRTDINKKDIEILSGGALTKVGDLDEVSHSGRLYPNFIIDDLDRVKVIINKLLAEHPGEKIAIVSDHGISYMSQMLPGSNLQGYQSDHWGRVAESTKDASQIVADDKYKVVSIPGDTTTYLCALKHESLLKKIPDGMGAHGGCTPEEQLVPIFIISPEKKTTTWKASLVNDTIEEANPIISFNILGLDSSAMPILEYDGKMYGMDKQGVTFTSERVYLKKDITKVTLHIGAQSKDFTISVKMAVEEEDPFIF